MRISKNREISIDMATAFLNAIFTKQLKKSCQSIRAVGFSQVSQEDKQHLQRLVFTPTPLTKQWQKGATATLRHVLKHDLDLSPQNDAWHFCPCCKGNTIQRVCTALELRASPLRPRHQPLMSSTFNFILYPTISWRPLPYPTDSSGSSSFVSLHFTFFNL